MLPKTGPVKMVWGEAASGKREGRVVAAAVTMETVVMVVPVAEVAAGAKV